MPPARDPSTGGFLPANDGAGFGVGGGSTSRFVPKGTGRGAVGGGSGPVTVVDRDRGYDQAMRALGSLLGAETLVGIHPEQGAQVLHPDDLSATLAEIAFNNEFGTETSPERSFMRATVDTNRDVYQAELKQALEQALDGRVPIGMSMALLGARVEGDIKAFITDLQEPPNAEATIKAKGSSNPLINTGRMRAEIKHVERGG